MHNSTTSIAQVWHKFSRSTTSREKTYLLLLIHQLKQHAPSEGAENTCNKAAKNEQQVDQQHLPVTTAASSKETSSGQETVTLTEEVSVTSVTKETTTKNTTSDTILLGTDKNSNTDNKTCEILKMSSEEAKEQEPEAVSATAKRPKTEDDLGEEKPVEMQGDEADGEDDIPAAKRPKTTDLAQPKSKAAALWTAKVSYSYKCITNFLSVRHKICNADFP